jgi:hypothetical protein
VPTRRRPHKLLQRSRGGPRPLPASGRGKGPVEGRWRHPPPSGRGKGPGGAGRRVARGERSEPLDHPKMERSPGGATDERTGSGSSLLRDSYPDRLSAWLIATIRWPGFLPCGAPIRLVRIEKALGNRARAAALRQFRIVRERFEIPCQHQGDLRFDVSGCASSAPRRSHTSTSKTGSCSGILSRSAARSCRAG